MYTKIPHLFLEATIFFICGVDLLTAQNGFYFATHTSYANASLSYASFFFVNISGSFATVTQQCRRNCALDQHCQAFQVQWLRNEISLGVFTCRYFASNPCSWTTTSLSTGSMPSSVLWDKLPVLDMKPKPCIDYCSVMYRGNCWQCRGYWGLTGFDCDRAPKLCSEYPPTGWGVLPIWPWGFYGPKLSVYCLEQRTTFLNLMLNNTGIASIGRLTTSGWVEGPYTSDPTKIRSQIGEMDWNLLSELVGMAENKELMVLLRQYADNRYVFSGFQMTPQGDLSLSAPVGTAVGFSTPLAKVPFMYNNSCNGFFWQFAPDVSICSQQSYYQFLGLHWNGVSYNDAHIYMTFS